VPDIDLATPEGRQAWIEFCHGVDDAHKRAGVPSPIRFTNEPMLRPRRGAVTAPHVRARESHRTRPGHRRSGATSTTASSDPGDPEPPRRRGELRHAGFALTAASEEIGGTR
jgi:hypothetical protein